MSGQHDRRTIVNQPGSHGARHGSDHLDHHTHVQHSCRCVHVDIVGVAGC